MTFPIATVEAFYAHALAIEREAAARYTEFEAFFQSRGEEVLAGLCHNLARLEAKHLAALLAESRDLDLPVIAAADYSWFEPGVPEAPPQAVLLRVASERQLLELVLAAEKRAHQFFERVARESPNEAVRRLAREMAIEEAEHLCWVRAALDYLPSRSIAWEEAIATPGRSRR